MLTRDLERRELVAARLRRAGVAASLLALQRVAREALVPSAFAVRQHGGYNRGRALRVLDAAEAALVVAHRTLAGEHLDDAIDAMPWLRPMTADATAAVVDAVLDAVKREWPDAGHHAAALGALVAMFVGDEVEQLGEVRA